MFFEAVYFGHFLSFYTMQLEPPKPKTTYDGFNHCGFPFWLFLVATKKDGS